MDPAELIRSGFRSITLENFANLVEMLTHMIQGATGVPQPTRGYTSEHLRELLIGQKLFLPVNYSTMFSLDEPEYVITYLWLGTTLRELYEILKVHFRGRNATFWLDILFNDQMVCLCTSVAACEPWTGAGVSFCSTALQEIDDALKKANTVYLGSPKHLVIFGRGVYKRAGEEMLEGGK